MNKKRIPLIIGFIASVFLIAWVLYMFFFRAFFPDDGTTDIKGNRNGSLPTVTNGNISVFDNTNDSIALPNFPGANIDLAAPTEVARGGLTKVNDYEVTSAKGLTSGLSGNAFYNENAGYFYRIGDDGVELLSDERFFNVETVTWSNQQDKAILEYPDGSNVIYNFETKKQITLPEEMTDFAFNPNGTTIATKWLGSNRDENWLMVGDADGQNFNLVEPLGDRQHNVQVSVSPDDQVVALYRKANDATTQTILTIGRNNENYKQFTVKGSNFESKWSPAQTDLLYSVAKQDEDYKPTLWITSGSEATLGSSHLDLQLNTWSSKCTFNTSGTSIYCAEPIELPRAAGLYPELAQGTPDVFYRIDLRSGQKIPLAVPVGNQPFYSAETVSLSPDESLLYFVDSNTGALHSIRLN